MEKKVVLYNPQAEELRPYRGVPLGLLSVSRLLHSEGYKIVIAEHSDKDVDQKLTDECEGVICLGVSAMTGYQIKDAIRAIKIVKKKHPHMPIVWGGWHPSILPTDTVKSKYADIVVRGQGEQTFTDLVHALENHTPLEEVAGIVFKQRGRIIANPERPFIDVNKFPPIPYELIEVDKHLINYDFGSRTIMYNSSQGCPFRCAFCADPEIYKRRWSGLEPARIVTELSELKKKYGINGVVFTDSNFFINEKHTIEFCQLCIKSKLGLKFGGVNGRADVLTRYSDRTWALMKKAGFRNILNGTESGSQVVLDQITKDITVEQIIDMVRIGAKHDISITCSTFIGLPGLHIEDEFKINIGLIDTLMKINPKNTYFFSIYTPYPGCKMYLESVKHGFKSPNKLESWAVFELRKTNTPWVPQRFAEISEQLSLYYFPILSDQITDILKHYPAMLRWPLIICYYPFRALAWLRWKLKFFSVPIDYHIFKFGLYIKDRF